MGERTAIQFVSDHDKSVWLYYHYYADFVAVSRAIAYVQEHPYDKTDGLRTDASGVVAGFVEGTPPECIFDSTTDYGDGSGMDWGAWRIDIKTGFATPLGPVRGIRRMTRPYQWDADEGVLLPDGNLERGT